MALLLSLLFVFAGVPQETTQVNLHHLPPQFQLKDSTNLPTPKIGVDSDGVIVGNTKYFIRILTTDPSIDPGMIRRIPDSRMFERLPRLLQPFREPRPLKPE